MFGFIELSFVIYAVLKGWAHAEGMQTARDGSMHPNIHLEKNGIVAERFRTGVSLHSHTLHSHETLSFIYRLGQTIAPIRFALERGERRYRRTYGQALDLTRAYWTPPLAPYDAWRLEHDHIAKRFALKPLVSITDHDSIEAPVTMRVLEAFHNLPVSVEWTVPFRRTFFHLGMHNLQPDRARQMMSEFEAFTAFPDERALPQLLQSFAANPASLIVFNHPCWDENLIGTDLYRGYVMEFCRLYGRYIHAVELNGLRPWKENKDVVALSCELGKPIISGGDRHGLEPNTILNLTNASTFEEFVGEVRCGISEVLFTSQYFEPFPVRVLQSVQDIMADHENHGRGWVRWSDRVFYIGDDGETRQVSQLWRDKPLAVRIFEGGVHALRHPGMRIAFRAFARGEAAL